MDDSENLSVKELFRRETKRLDEEYKKSKNYDFSKRIDRTEEVQKFREESLNKYVKKTDPSGGDEVLEEAINDLCDDLKYMVERSDTFYNNASNLVENMIKFSEDENNFIPLQKPSDEEVEEVRKATNFSLNNQLMRGSTNIDFFNNPTSTIFGSFRKDLEKIYENEDFIENIGKAISELHTIPEWIEILDPNEKPDLWVKKIDDILEEIERQREFSEYIVEMEKIREVLKHFFNMFLTLPIITKSCQCNLCYFLELLNYGGFTRISEYFDLAKEKDDEGKSHMIVSVVEKIMRTVYYVNMRTVSTSGMGIFYGNIKPLEWESEEEEDKIISKQAFIEYNEYLTEKGFFIPQKSSFSGQCSIT